MRDIFVWVIGGVVGILKHLNFVTGEDFAVDRGTDEKYAVNLSALMRDEKTAKIAASSLGILKSLLGSVSTTNQD